MNNARSYHHGNVPSAIVDAALECLATDVTPDLSLRALARRVGVSATAVYRHFRNKEELLGAIAERGFLLLAAHFASVLDLSRPADSPGNAIESLLRLGGAYLEFAITNPNLFRLVFGSEARAYRERVSEQDRSEQGEGRSSVSTYQYLEQVLADLVSVGVLPAEKGTGPRDLLFAWAVIHGYANLALGGIRGIVDRDVDSIAEEAAVGIIASLRERRHPAEAAQSEAGLTWESIQSIVSEGRRRR
jgi:AcrR family transcriptional regulator